MNKWKVDDPKSIHLHGYMENMSNVDEVDPCASGASAWI